MMRSDLVSSQSEKGGTSTRHADQNLDENAKFVLVLAANAWNLQMRMHAGSLWAIRLTLLEIATCSNL